MIKEIKFTDKALKQIENLLSKKDEGSFFRIAIKGGGCSGFQYEFTFDKSAFMFPLIQSLVIVSIHHAEDIFDGWQALLHGEMILWHTKLGTMHLVVLEHQLLSR
mgnify:CR=1 FL=1